MQEVSAITVIYKICINETFKYEKKHGISQEIVKFMEAKFFSNLLYEEVVPHFI